MEIHSRQMQVNQLMASGPDKVRVSLSEVSNGTGPGMGAGATGFGYDVEKGNEPKIGDVQTVTVNTDV